MKIKSLVTTLLTIGLIMPASAAYADWFGDVIEAAKEGNGTYVETHSSVSTGGQTVRSGETVTTGDSSASSHVETRIDAGNDGGEVSVKIETTENGETKTEEYSKSIEPGSSVKVEAKAESKDGAYTSVVEVDDEKVEPTSSATAAPQIAAVSVAVGSRISLLFTERIPGIFKRVFGFLWRF